MGDDLAGRSWAGDFAISFAEPRLAEGGAVDGVLVCGMLCVVINPARRLKSSF